MRLFTPILVVSALAVAAATSAHADAKVVPQTSYYEIAGGTGKALLDAMDRKGPKHGFLARAIAQTHYTMHSSADWNYRDGVCRTINVDVTLDVTYIYPRISNPIDARLKQRWAAFLSGVEDHEQVHGRIASEMADTADRAVRALAVRDGSSCKAAQRVMKRKVDEIVAAYERKQVQFDKDEHRDGGRVDRLVNTLLGARSP